FAAAVRRDCLYSTYTPPHEWRAGGLIRGTPFLCGTPYMGMVFPCAALLRRLPQNAECSSRSAPGHYTPLPHNITCPGARSPRVGDPFSVPLTRWTWAHACGLCTRQRVEQCLRWRPIPTYSAPTQNKSGPPHPHHEGVADRRSNGSPGRR